MTVTDPNSAPELATVAVCTNGRRVSLRGCLASLRTLDDPNYEVLVVDNTPDGTVDRELVEAVGGRYVHEPRPGLDRARNRAVAAARGDLLAFTDDDCEVERSWLRELRRAFDSDDQVALVTGRVLPARLEYGPLQWFEDRFSFDRGPLPDRFHRDDRSREWFPTYPWHLGTGANMAFRREIFDEIEGFDPGLDMGSPVGGGGDLDIFAQVIDAGAVAVYQPTAVVLHHHRGRRRQLVRQLHGYGATMSALCTKYVLHRPGHRRQALRFAWHILKEELGRLAAWTRGEELPLYLILAEIAGFLWGPVAYARGRWFARGP